jgi:hypothetical protein
MESRALRELRRLPLGVRRDLLRVLTSPSNVRADIIRQFHDRGDVIRQFHERGNSDMVELLVLLEEEERKQQAVIEELQRLA